MLPPLAFMVAVTLQAAPLPKAPDPPPNLVGRWSVVEMYSDGVKQSRQTFEHKQIEITDAGELFFMFTQPRKMEVRYQIKIDDKRLPARLDMIDEGMVTPAIYKGEAGGVIIVFGKDARDRPADFLPRKGDGRLRYTLKRIEDKR